MKVRLDTNVNHMPVVQRGKDRGNNVCQLHRWADKEFNPTIDKKGKKMNTKPKGGRSSIMRCTVCDVNLCIPSWEIFHTQQRLRSHIP